MGLWSILTVLDKKNKWFTVGELIKLSKLNKPNVLLSVRKAVAKGFAITEKKTEKINNKLVTFKVYKSKKFIE